MTRSAIRRNSDQVRAAIVRVATDEFSARGYANTTLRGVAAAAGVSMSVLHHHFGSKQELFSAALITPFLQFFDDFATAWVERSERFRDERELTREFVAHLYRNLSKNRLALVNLLALSESEPQILDDVRAGLGEIRIKLQDLERRDAHARNAGLSPDTAPDANRMIVSLVTGLVVLHPFLADRTHSEDDHFIDLATNLLTDGIQRKGPRHHPY